MLAEVVALTFPDVPPLVIRTKAGLEILVEVKQSGLIGIGKRANIWLLLHIDQRFTL
jgi:hypothetical protein